MAMCIKLKVLSLFDMTRVQSSRIPFVKSLLIDSSFYIWLESGAFESHAEYKTDGSGSGGKLTGFKMFRWHAANFSITVSYRKHTWKHVTHGRHAFVWQSGTLSHCMTSQTTSCPVQFRSHSACVARTRLWVLKIYRYEFGYRMWLSFP